MTTVSDRSTVDRSDGRPTAEEMLARIGTAGAERDRGRLRVYLGMAPGVGKTYRMLEEGHRRHGAWHGPRRRVRRGARPAGDRELLDGLEIVPRRRVEYRGVVVEEMDTDAIVRASRRSPWSTSWPTRTRPGRSARSAGRTSTILLDAGIDVVSTCNIQHLESVADAVATITGAPVNERIPDEVLAAADEVELVDMSPYALRQRMRHGNVYPPDRTRGGARPVLHRVEPHGAARARAALRGRPGRRAARGRIRAAPSGTSPNGSSCSSIGRRRRPGRFVGPRRRRPSCARRSSRSWSRRRPRRRIIRAEATDP